MKKLVLMIICAFMSVTGIANAGMMRSSKGGVQPSSGTMLASGLAAAKLKPVVSAPVMHVSRKPQGMMRPQRNYYAQRNHDLRSNYNGGGYAYGYYNGGYLYGEPVYQSTAQTYPVAAYDDYPRYVQGQQPQELQPVAAPKLIKIETVKRVNHARYSTNMPNVIYGTQSSITPYEINDGYAPNIVRVRVE